ncbi:glycosyltransferase family 4 protein [Bradyrhizobium sp. 4]|uniref:glycosyltransferase family 4 protein n=1 Tax=unclassified Bradyrhizobium TaxID=2631580 RepID=UPI001FF7946E|nr:MULTISPECIES: glycosyltransferase family 1 protein [unclassified Bradyrhizobium]MCK1397441.1 glycosyltransferase family 4 protein [Bradyrhizobium sp. 39]MCK1752520.1 glycosyltransferase family 4 protein [Bradyrhizobium sp. 135]UPJ36739.1 glycosyltransferase family 4 protein [Bradyrhizobium sp. 4]
MRVALLTDTFARRTRFGLSRYSHEIYGGLTRQGVSTIPVSSVSDFGGDPPDWLIASGFRRLPLSRRVLATLWASGSPAPQLERWLGKVDIVHSLDVDYPVRTKRPWVVTYHDLGVLTHPEYFGKARAWLLKAQIAAAVRRAAAIICVSQATADEFLSLGGRPAANRVHVIEEGVGEEFFAAPSTKAIAALPQELSERPFFLFTGSISPRKNLARVVTAFASIIGRIPHQLVLTGARGWDSADELKVITTSGVADRIVELGYVSEDVLKSLYARAAGFLYPSLYEGFGLPILEAMAAGCPVITSNIPPMTEVGGGAAIYVDPCRASDIADAMLLLADNEREWQLRRLTGRSQAGQFSWDSCVQRTARLYADVMQGQVDG